MLDKLLTNQGEYGTIFLRLVVGIRLIYGTIPFIFSFGRMEPITKFFKELGIPFPLFNAHVSVIAQLGCGVLFVLGFFTRYAAAIMVFNFTIAIIYHDIHQPFDKAFPAWAILAVSGFLLLNGPGKWSVNNR